MKKFIVFCLILIVTVSLGATVYYFMRDNEELVVNVDPYIYINAGTGDIIEVDAQLKNAKIGNKVVMSSLNEDVLAFNPALNAFEPTDKGGAAVIEVKTTSKKIPAIYIEVHVGIGSKEAPFYLDSQEDLFNIGKDAFLSNSYYLLKQDIALTGVVKPILNDNNTGFSGTLDGNGYTISGLNIQTAEGVANAGLFSKVATTGVITNLTLSNVNINGQFETAGSFAGINLGNITRCDANGSVISTLNASSVGGIVGINRYSNSNVGRIDRCFSTASVSGVQNIGGLAGRNEGAIVINSYVNLDETKSIETIGEESYVGGLVGYNTELEGKKATVKNCYSVANVVVKEGVSTDNVKLASLIGYNNEISREEMNYLMGNYADNTSLNAINNEFNRTFTETEQSKQTNFRGVYNSFPKDADNNIIVNELISFVSKVVDTQNSGTKDTKICWDFTNVWNLNATVNNGYPTLNRLGASVPDDLHLIYDPSNIGNAEDLMRFANAVNNGTAESYYALTNDITLTGDFTPIGTTSNPFSGTFDGNGFKISGLTISSPTIESLGEYKDKTIGLFGKISSTAIIKNLTIENVSFADGARFAGSVVGYSEGTIKNVKVTQTARNKDANNIVASEAVGGIAGVNYGLIESCKVECQTITSKALTAGSTRYAGGIAGANGADNTTNKAIIINSSVVTSYVYDNEMNSDFPSGFESDFTRVIAWENPIIKALTKHNYYVGGITGANFYQIKSNYVYNTDLKTDIYSTTGSVAGVTALSKATTLLNENVAEVSYNVVVDGNISGFMASGLVGHLYGIANYNQVGLTTTSAMTKLQIKGIIISGLVNDIKVNGRLNNCFTNAHLANTYEWGFASGMANYARFQSKSYYGEFETIFSACSFESTNENSRYDSNASYRQESNIGWDTRTDGYGNHLIWIETGHATYDKSNYFGDSRQNDIYGISENEASFIENKDNIINLFTTNGFDTQHWEFATMQYAKILNLPEIDEIA